MNKKFKNSNTSLRKDQKQEQIFKTALTLFSRYGYKKTTIEDVTSALGMTKSNLYFYVANKQDLYEKTVGNELKKWRGHVAYQVGQTQDVVDKFTVMAKTSFSYLEDHDQLRQILIDDPTIFTLDPEEDRFLEINMSAMALIKDILVSGIEQDRFMPVDIDHTVELLFSIYIMFLIKTYVKSQGSSSTRMYTQGLEIVLRGLIKPPDQSLAQNMEI